MKINFFKYFLLIILFFTSVIIYLSLVGIETKKFNQQIKDTVIQSNNNLDVSLKKVKLKLDPFKFKINAKTVGATIYYSKKSLPLEYIKSHLSLNSLIKNKIVSSKIEFATKPFLINDLIQFTRVEIIIEKLKK